MILFQFHVDYRPAGPLRSDWHEAANDAVVAGYAVWSGKNTVTLEAQAHIARTYFLPEANGAHAT